MRIPPTPAAKAATALAAPVAIVTAAALIWSASNAAFSATTRNSGNNWSTGTVALSDDDAGSATFQVANMLPGQTQTKCITVTAKASVPGTVRTYALNASGDPNLLSHILISMASGTGGSFGSCTGFTWERDEMSAASRTSLADFAAISSYAGATLVSDWVVPAGTTSRTYKVTWTFDATGLTQAQLDDLQGRQTGVDAQWELQNA
jgi:hypothetical protein